MNEAGIKALDAFGIAHTHLAYNDAECVKLPFNPSQPQIFGIFCGLSAFIPRRNGGYSTPLTHLSGMRISP